MTNEEKFAQDALITQAAATLMAAAIAARIGWDVDDCVEEALAIYHVAIGARIKGETK